MATEVGAIKASLTLNTTQFRAGMDRAKRDLTEVKSGADSTARSFSGLESALAAVGAGAALTGLIRTVKTLVGEANQLAMSMQGLAEVSKALGISVKETTGLAEELAGKGFMTVAEASTAVKTALSSGLNLEETRKLIYATADAAAYNREAHLGWGEAIVQVMRGVKSGNSELTDAAGITTNLSVMYDRYAKSIGTTAAKLTEAQKIQAAYTEIMKEATLFAGNADTAMEGFAGTQAEFTKTMATARAELGEALLPVVQELLETVTPMIKEFAAWTAENEDVIVGVASAAAAFLGLVTVLGTVVTVMGAVRVAALALGTSLGPIGWAIMAISVAAGLFVSYKTKVDAAAAAQKNFNDMVAAEPPKRSAADVEQMRDQAKAIEDATNKMKELREEQERLQKKLDSGDFGKGEGYRSVKQALSDVVAEIKTTRAEFEKLGVTEKEAAQSIARLTTEAAQSVPYIRELRMEALKDAAAKQAQIKESEQLSKRYAELSKQTKLTEAESGELTQTVRSLTTKYPELHVEMNKQGKLLITNEGLIRELIKAEQDSVNATLTAEAAKRSSMIRTTEDSIKSAKKQIQALQAIAAVEPKSAAWAEGSAGVAFMSKAIQGQANKAVSKAEQELTALNGLLTEYKTELAAIENGTWGSLVSGNKAGGPSASATPPSDKKTGSGSKPKTAEQLAQEAYNTQLQVMEKQRLLGKLTEQQEADKLAALAKQYAKYDAIWIDAESRRQQVVAQIEADQQRLSEERARKSEEAARSGFEKSSEWIDAETRRLTEKGASEREIAEMQLAAWTRVRNRYDKESEYYKQADRELFGLRMELRKLDEEAVREAAEANRKAQADLTDSVLDNIDKQRKAELDALDERKAAIEKFYDDQLAAIDEAERGRDRAALEAEAEKYRNATSEAGRKRYAELMEQLRKMDVEDQKSALEAERDEKLDALDRQKDDIDAWYDDLKEAAQSFTGDMTAIYKLVDDERLKSFKATNETIKAEMIRFQTEMATLQAGAAGATSDPAVIAQMAANSKAWATADEDGKAQLAADNKRLGASIGATHDSGSGKWFDAAGLPLFHTGRDGMTGQTFSSGNMLMPDELAAILRADEYVFTPGQLRSLIDSVSGRGGNSVVIEKIVGVEMNDTMLEDEIDVRAIGRTGIDMATEMARRQYAGGVR